MFNDLRSFPEIRERYQFWFYCILPGNRSGIVLPNCAGICRTCIAFDPKHKDKMMDQMVLVGHTWVDWSAACRQLKVVMIFGGVSVTNRLVLEEALKIRGPEAERNKLVSTLFFKPNQSIRRVVTIGTPHRGSDFANDYTRWLARKFIKLPTMAVMTGNRLFPKPESVPDTDLPPFPTQSILWHRNSDFPGDAQGQVLAKRQVPQYRESREVHSPPEVVMALLVFKVQLDDVERNWSWTPFTPTSMISKTILKSDGLLNTCMMSIPEIDWHTASSVSFVPRMCNCRSRNRT